MIWLFLACPTPDTTVPTQTISTPEAAPPSLIPPTPPVAMTAFSQVFVAQDADGTEHPRTRFSIHATVEGVEHTATVEVPGVCTREGDAWTCDGKAVDLLAFPDVVALVPTAQPGAAPAVVTWNPATPTITVPVRLRYNAQNGKTALIVEAFKDDKVVATGQAEIAGTCVPSASPPAGREDGNVYLTCTDAGVSSLVKLVERDRNAALTRRLTSEKAVADTVFFTLNAPDGVRFDL